MQIVTVLRSGGDFEPKHVEGLRKQVEATVCESGIGWDYDFTCLSDVEGHGYTPLLHNWPGWWAKLEMFRLRGPCIYLDLDTIVKDLEPLADAVKASVASEFFMLRPWNKEERGAGGWASGVMAWSGDWEHIMHCFVPAEDMPHHRWDQRYITNALSKTTGAQIRAVQDAIKVRSYKRDFLEHGRNDYDIMCYHGKPRPWDTNDLWEVMYGGH